MTDYTGMSGPSFRFRLERVRGLRERTEDLAKAALAGALVRHQRCEDALRDAEERLAQARAAHLHGGTVPSSAAELIARQAWLERAEQAHRVTRDDLDRHELELADRRNDLTIAARDRQALERLKEHRRAAHERERVRLEGLAIDEVAINGFRRRAA